MASCCSFFAQLFPGYAAPWRCSLWELQDVVVVVPEEAELFVAGFFVCFLFSRRGVSRYLSSFRSRLLGYAGRWCRCDDFDDSVCFQLLYEAVGSARWPVENGAPTTVAVQAFTSFAHDGASLMVGELCFRVVDFYKKLQKSFYFSFMGLQSISCSFSRAFGIMM